MSELVYICNLCKQVVRDEKQLLAHLDSHPRMHFFMLGFITDKEGRRLGEAEEKPAQEVQPQPERKRQDVVPAVKKLLGRPPKMEEPKEEADLDELEEEGDLLIE